MNFLLLKKAGPALSGCWVAMMIGMFLLIAIVFRIDDLTCRQNISFDCFNKISVVSFAAFFIKIQSG